MSILTDGQDVVSANNRRLFKLMSIYLNLAPDYITREMMDEITGGESFGAEFAFAHLAAAACGLDVYGNNSDKAFFRSHFLPMFKLLDVEPYKHDPYYQNIKFEKSSSGKWTFEQRVCKEYEAFVYDDPVVFPDGRIIPSIGFFNTDYPFPAVCEGGREWMTLMPNETNTTKPAIKAARGRVLTYGLGLGYFTYMAHMKSNVDSVTVVELSDDAIELFTKHILPQFDFPEKINIIKADAFEFAENQMKDDAFDMVFVDIWHDPGDGCDLYLRMKQFENQNPNTQFVYWIEDTLKLYI